MKNLVLAAGLAAAAAAVPQLADAGHGGSCCDPCGGQAFHAQAAYGGASAEPAATHVERVPYHGPTGAAIGSPATSPPAVASSPAPPPPTDAGPPVASGSGQVVRRFSYEPGADVAAPAAPLYEPSGQVSQPAGYGFRSAGASYDGRSRRTVQGWSRSGLTGEARLHPGRGRRW